MVVVWVVSVVIHYGIPLLVSNELVVVAGTVAYFKNFFMLSTKEA